MSGGKVAIASDLGRALRWAENCDREERGGCALDRRDMNGVELHREIERLRFRGKMLVDAANNALSCLRTARKYRKHMDGHHSLAMLLYAGELECAISAYDAPTPTAGKEE